MGRMDQRSKVLARFFSAFMQIYGVERRNEEYTRGALRALMVYCAFTLHGIFSIGLESSFRYDSDQLKCPCIVFVTFTEGTSQRVLVLTKLCCVKQP